MPMNIKDFSQWFGSLNDIHIVDVQENKIVFYCVSEPLMFKITKTADATSNLLSLHNSNDQICMCLHCQNMENFYNSWNAETKSGVPDLSWVTCKEMANELKKRENITFALVWIEDSGMENINLEASGNPTMLCGLLSRGLNMAVKFADKNMKFHETQGE